MNLPEEQRHFAAVADRSEEQYSDDLYWVFKGTSGPVQARAGDADEWGAEFVEGEWVLIGQWYEKENLTGSVAREAADAGRPFMQLNEKTAYLSVSTIRKAGFVVTSVRNYGRKRHGKIYYQIEPDLHSELADIFSRVYM